MDYHKMRVRDIKEELRIRGFKRYSKLKKGGFDSVSFYWYPSNEPITENSKNGIQGLLKEPVMKAMVTHQPLFSTEDINTSVNQIVTGDCLQILPTFSDSFFDCCITDPYI